MRGLKTFLWMITVALVVLFSIENRDVVSLRFVLFPIENYQWIEVPRVFVPLIPVILFSIFFGVLIGGIDDLCHRLQLQRALRQNQKTIERLQNEIQSLRGSECHQAPIR
jgi:uncharacterized integral membrane protein